MKFYVGTAIIVLAGVVNFTAGILKAPTIVVYPLIVLAIIGFIIQLIGLYEVRPSKIIRDLESRHPFPR